MSLFKRKKNPTAGEILGKDSTAYTIALEIVESNGMSLWELDSKLNLVNSTVRYHLRDKEGSLLKEEYVRENEDGKYYATDKLKSLFYEVDIERLLLLNLLTLFTISVIEVSYQIKLLVAGVIAFILLLFSRAKS